MIKKVWQSYYTRSMEGKEMKETLKSFYKPISETKQQIQLVKWAALNNIPLVHIPNQGLRTGKTGAIMARMGMKKGFPDLMLLEARGGYFGLFIEMKQDKRYTTSETNTQHWKDQEYWLRHLLASGYEARMAFGWEHGVGLIEKYLSYDLTKDHLGDKWG